MSKFIFRKHQLEVYYSKLFRYRNKKYIQNYIIHNITLAKFISEFSDHKV